jgi:uncharacterized protein YuzE
MQFDYDPEANALYIHLAARPYSHGRDLDPERRVDYAADGTAIGIELTCVRSGVNIESLPASEQITEILHSLDIPIFA